MLYIVHVLVDHDVLDKWTRYMREQHIDDVLDTGCFQAAWMTRNEERDDEHGVAFTMCYESPNAQTFEHYQSEHAPALKQDHADRFAGKVRATRELLPVIKRFARQT